MIKWFLLLFCSSFSVLNAQGCSIGDLHNILLEQMLVSEQVQAVFNKPIFSCGTSYGDAEMEAILHYNNLPKTEFDFIQEFLSSSDEVKIEDFSSYVDSLEKIAKQRRYTLSTLGFFDVAKKSKNLWRKHIWDDNKPPFAAVVKADALGFLKGIVLGAVVWIGSNFLFQVPDAYGIVAGSVITVGFTALDSFRFVKRYKKRSQES